ncbi:MAG TPA: HD domain-containing phosphohydrolase [Urbifossiella sp.]|jgi:HD-GYP domain-containing protein (c-di-GMP phosphodiesterase class II)
MSDVRNLLDRISAFRHRLEATPRIIPEAVPIEPEVIPTAFPVPESFRQSLREPGTKDPVPEGPPPLTDRARQLLGDAQTMLARQRRFAAEPMIAGLSNLKDAAADSLIAYHRETVGVLDCAIRLAQSFPESPSMQLKLCDGLHGMLGIISERLDVQEKALAQRQKDESRIDRIAVVYTAMNLQQAVVLNHVAALAEELLEDARQTKPLRFVHADLHSTQAYPGGAESAAPARHLAAHAVNTAQVVARIVPFDYEWASRPLVPVVAALMMECGMMRTPIEMLAKFDLTADERRVIEQHPRYGADLLTRYATDAAPLAAAVATHHERNDGTGYPMGLKNAAIPSIGRMLAAADTYAALCCPRPYRAAHDTRTALTDVLLLADHGQLDKDFAEYLVNLTFYPIGSVVELTDGRFGMIAANHANRMDPRSPGRPVVAILAEADGTLHGHPEHVDFSLASRGGILRTVTRERRKELLGRRYPELC